MFVRLLVFSAGHLTVCLRYFIWIVSVLSVIIQLFKHIITGSKKWQQSISNNNKFWVCWVSLLVSVNKILWIFFLSMIWEIHSNFSIRDLHESVFKMIIRSLTYFYVVTLLIFTEAFNFGDRQGASASGMAPYQPFLQQVPNLLGNPQFPQAGSTQYHIPQQQQQQTALQTSLQVSLFWFQ